MRLLPALFVAVALVACARVKLPPVSPDQVEVYYEYEGHVPQEEHERLALTETTFSRNMCSSARRSPCDDDDVWDFGLENLKEWAADMGADALLIHRTTLTQGNLTYFYASAIYYPSKHPEVQK